VPCVRAAPPSRVPSSPRARRVLPVVSRRPSAFAWSCAEAFLDHVRHDRACHSLHGRFQPATRHESRQHQRRKKAGPRQPGLESSPGKGVQSAGSGTTRLLYALLRTGSIDISVRLRIIRCGSGAQCDVEFPLGWSARAPASTARFSPRQFDNLMRRAMSRAANSRLECPCTC
jgi:hypothetical protein